LSSWRKDQLAAFHGDDNAKLLQEVQRILTPIDRTEVINAFGHWIERCQSVATNKGEYDPESSITAFLLFFTYAHICR
jgi:hypothetical protein